MEEMFRRKDRQPEGAPPPAEGSAGSEELAILRDQVDKLMAERDEAQSRYLRSLADYQNYQRRALQNENVARAEGTSRVVKDVANVIDHFDLALGQDLAKLGPGAQQVLSGLRVIREELMKVLLAHGVGLIQPAPNDEFMPGRHEAIMQRAEPGIKPGHIAATFQPGYTLTTAGVERVLRPAKVSVAPSESDSMTEGDSGPEGATLS